MKNENKVAKIVSQLLEGERTGWPPVCAGIFYQPKRPSIFNSTQTPTSMSVPEEKTTPH